MRRLLMQIYWINGLMGHCLATPQLAHISISFTRDRDIVYHIVMQWPNSSIVCFFLFKFKSKSWDLKKKQKKEVTHPWLPLSLLL